MKLNETNIKIDGKNLGITIILPFFNEELGLELLENSDEELLNINVQAENLQVI